MSISRAILPTLLRSATALTLIAGPAFAKEPPLVLKGVPGVTYEGVIGGMDAWSREGEDVLWLQTADGAHVVAGVLFNNRGVDMGAALRGKTGMTIEDLVAAQAVEPGLADDLLPSLVTDAAPSPVAEALVASIGNGSPGAAGAYLEAQDALAALPQEARTQALITLVQSIDAASSPEEFNKAIADWQQVVADLVKENTGATVELPAVTTGSAMATPVIPSLSSDPQTVSYDEDRLVDMLGTETFWFSVGSVGAPTVYAVIDPTCPYCARAMNTLKAEVEEGRLELRIILAPLVTAQAPDVIAAILADSDPVSAFWNHELDLASGGSGIAAVPFVSLPEDYQAAVRTNYAVASENNLPGVPYFIYENEAGEQRFSGVPQAEQFQDAIALPKN